MRPSGLLQMSLEFRMLRFPGEGEDLGSSFLLVIMIPNIYLSFPPFAQSEGSNREKIHWCPSALLTSHRWNSAVVK
jgi:hypothetical protein